MDASYINPFVQCAQRVFATVCQESPSLGKVYLKTRPYTTDPFTVSVDVFGAFEGEIVYNMQIDAGIFIASRMMMGMPVADLHDEIARSAVSELANIISGNVATVFADREIAIDIKPPSVRFSPSETDFPMTAKVKRIVCVPLHFKNGHVFQVDVIIA